MHDLQCWYQVLELEPGASLEEVNQAHKDLALVWHPDRLPKDSVRLQEKAEAKLKEINHARDRLREHQAKQQSSSNGRAQTTPTARKSSPAQPATEPQSRPQTYQKTPTRAAEQYSYPHAQATRSTNRQPQHKTASRTPSQRADLSGQDLSGKDLSERDFSGRNLSNANLSQVNLKDSFLHGINLSGANLTKANLFRANMLQANLSNANLREANLIGADLSGADLSGADLTGAQIEVGSKIMVRLMGANLSGTIMPNGKVHV
jgi:curved DNA-binding protein CbpA